MLTTRIRHHTRKIPPSPYFLGEMITLFKRHTLHTRLRPIPKFTHILAPLHTSCRSRKIMPADEHSRQQPLHNKSAQHHSKSLASIHIIQDHRNIRDTHNPFSAATINIHEKSSRPQGRAMLLRDRIV